MANYNADTADTAITADQAPDRLVLNAVGADNISTRPLFVPPGIDATAAQANGEFTMGGQRVWAQYTAYLAQGTAGSMARDDAQRQRGVLVEHNTFVTAEARPRLHPEIVRMGDAVYQALISGPIQP